MVPREAAAYVKVLDLLLRASSKIIYVAPFFRADERDEAGPVVAICVALAGSAVDVEVHFGDELRSDAVCISRGDGVVCKNGNGFLLPENGNTQIPKLPVSDDGPTLSADRMYCLSVSNSSSDRDRELDPFPAVGDQRT
jgi:hypothetical protein